MEKVNPKKINFNYLTVSFRKQFSLDNTKYCGRFSN
jgi:hypothetical protein